MGKTTGISWCDHTQNSWWGCSKVSPGCKFCYAETLSNRFGENIWGTDAARRIMKEKNWNLPLKWDKEAKKKGVSARCFTASMSDVMEDREDLLEARKRLFKLIKDTPNLDWLVLTKRPENYMKLGFLPEDWGNGYPNVWLGTSVENKDYLWRAEELAKVPAAIRFLSVEPLLGPLSIKPVVKNMDWIIVGGESGNEARPMDLGWVRSIRDETLNASKLFFFKQKGTVLASNMKCKDKKGGNPEEWPEDLKMQDSPERRKLTA